MEEQPKLPQLQRDNEALRRQLNDQIRLRKFDMDLNAELHAEVKQLAAQISETPKAMALMAEIFQADSTGKLEHMWENNLQIIRNRQRGGNASRGNRFSQPLLLALLNVHNKCGSGVLGDLSDELLLGAACRTTMKDYMDPFKPSVDFGPKAADNVRTQKEKYAKVCGSWKGKSRPEHNGRLALDEVNHLGKATYSNKDRKFIGWNLTSDELATMIPVYEMLKLDEPLLAQYTMCCQWTCHDTRFSFLGPIQSSHTGLRDFQINDYFWSCVRLLERFDFHVDLCIMDGAAANESFVMMNTGMKSYGGPIIACGPNRFTGGTITYMFDYPHMLKNIRNQLFKSLSSKKPRHFDLLNC